MDETKRKFSENLRKLLEIKGWSQSELARRLDVQKQTVSCWCRGVALPNSDTLDDIARLFGVDRGSLISFLDFDQRIPSALLAYMSKLNSEGLQKLEERAEELLEVNRYRAEIRTKDGAIIEFMEPQKK